MVWLPVGAVGGRDDPGLRQYGTAADVGAVELDGDLPGYFGDVDVCASDDSAIREEVFSGRKKWSGCIKKKNRCDF